MKRVDLVIGPSGRNYEVDDLGADDTDVTFVAHRNTPDAQEVTVTMADILFLADTHRDTKEREGRT